MALNGAGKETPQEDKQLTGTSLQHFVLYGLIGIQSQGLLQFLEEGKDKKPQLEDVGLSRFSPNISQDPHMIVCCCNVIFHYNVESVKKPLVL